MAESRLVSLCLMVPVVGTHVLRMGILLCEERCLHLKGCRGIGFVKEDLQCQLHTEEPQSLMQGHIITKKFQNACLVLRCTSGERCISTRAQNDICVNGTEYVISQRKLKSGDPRLFILPYIVTTDNKFRQMNLRSREIHEYTHLNLAGISAACYMEMSEQLLISSHQPPVLVSHHVDTGNIRVIRKNVVCHVMAVDEEAKLLFSKPSLIKPEFARLSLAGGDGDRFPLGAYGPGPQCLTLDKANKLLYSTFKNAIISISYNFKNISRILPSKDLCALTFEPMGGYLYFARDDILYKINPSTADTDKIAELPARPNFLQYFNNSVYVSTHVWVSDTPLFIVDLLNDGEIIPLIKASSYVSKFIVCLVT